MSRTALLSMDLQLSNLAHAPADYLPAAIWALETARAAQIPVIHVVLQLRPGHVLVTKVFTRRGDVLTTSEWADTLT